METDACSRIVDREEEPESHLAMGWMARKFGGLLVPVWCGHVVIRKAFEPLG
ncbi:MAG: hypothetical protein ACE5Z5_04075 [Candidatus Bathyarchaeia archaeon]